MVSNATKWYESKKKFGGHTKIKSGHKTGYIRTGAYWLNLNDWTNDQGGTVLELWIWGLLR